MFAVLTADHIIEPIDAFQAGLSRGFELVEADAKRLVTFSINPTYPATGFGYVERGEPISGFEDAFTARRFKEKPDEQTAKEYVASRRFGWNSGMFVFHAGSFLEALSRFKSETHQAMMRIADAWGTDTEQSTLEEIYPSLEKISVDFAVMEPASHDNQFSVCTINMDLTWLDVGSWPSYAETLTADDRGNRTNARTSHVDSKNILAVSDHPEHLIATIGCENLIVVHTGDVTLVCSADHAQRVKELAEAVDSTLR